jgi:hypothetical protein
MRTIKQLSKEALDVQDACNLCGVAQSFARVMIDLGDHCPMGTQQRNSHPITIVWLDKMNSLAGIQCFSAPGKEIENAFDQVTAWSLESDVQS